MHCTGGLLGAAKERKVPTAVLAGSGATAMVIRELGDHRPGHLAH